MDFGKSMWLQFVFVVFILQERIEGKISRRETEYSLPRRLTFELENYSLEHSNSEDRFYEMNISLQKRLNKAENKEDFAKIMGILENRIGGPRNAPKSSGEEFPNAGCTPILTPVKLSVTTDPSVVYYPMCVLLERCGGCCYGSFLSCQAESKEVVKVEVMKISSTSRGRRSTPNESEEIVVVEEERHLQCGCKCTVTEEDCNPQIQAYNENECACKCLDRDGRTKCLNMDNTHFWDEKQCACFCREVLECSTSSFYDHTDCRCKISSGVSSRRSIGFSVINESLNLTATFQASLLCITFLLVQRNLFR